MNLRARVYTKLMMTSDYRDKTLRLELNPYVCIVRY